jgi:hypothetical protein
MANILHTCVQQHQQSDTEGGKTGIKLNYFITIINKVQTHNITIITRLVDFAHRQVL